MTDAPTPRGADAQTVNVDAGGREARLAESFVALADTLVADFDVIDLLHTLAERCLELLGAGEAGIMLADQRGGLRIAAASAESARLLELFELQVSEGPCLECYTSGMPVVSRDLKADYGRWPHFTPRAHADGFRAVSAIPLRLREQVIGALNLFHVQPGGLDQAGQRVGQALADVATIGILQERALRRGEILSEQLQTALNSRIVIEQAKGILAEHGGAQLTMDDAFNALRGYARAHHRRLSELAADVVDRVTDLNAIVATARPSTPDGRH
jgi:transcriptional regulator with GAF, ATPase, and Fis domain